MPSETGVLAPTRVGRRRDREWISERFPLVYALEHDLGQAAEAWPPRPAPRTDASTKAPSTTAPPTSTGPWRRRARPLWCVTNTLVNEPVGGSALIVVVCCGPGQNRNPASPAGAHRAVCLRQNWYAYRVQNWTLTTIHFARTVKTWSTRERTRRSRRYRRGSAGTVARCSCPRPIRTSGRAGCATW
jgi:hypothetical protein